MLNEKERHARLGGRHAVRFHVRADELDNVVHGSAWLKNCRNPDLLQARDILIGNDATHQHQHVIHLILLEQIHDPRHDRIMRAGQDRETNHVDIFLQSSADDHLRRLAQPGIDDFHAGVAQSAGNNFRPAIVPVQAGFRYQDTDLWLIRHANI
jgi:hypothetical protein